MINRKISIFVLIFCVLKLTLSLPTAVRNGTNSHPVSKEVISEEIPNAKLTAVTGPYETSFYRKAAVENGMDPDAVAEVVRTGRPVVRVENDQNGAKRTTTYSLQPDGSISRHTRTEYRPTFTSSVQPYLPTSSTSKSLSSFPTETTSDNGSKKDGDWEWNPSNMPRFGSPPNHSNNFPSYTPNWQVPIFTYDQRPQVSKTPVAETTTTQFPEKTYWRYPGSPAQTDVVNGIDTSDVGSVTKTLVDGDNRKITTVHTVGPTEWHTRTVTLPWSEFASKTTTTKRPQMAQPPVFPSLDDFLKSQYATTMKTPTDSKQVPSLLPNKPALDSATRPVTTININDLPIVEVLDIGKTNKNHVDTVPEFKTQTKTYTKTIQTSGAPQVSDLDPNMKDILEKAGINPSDVLASGGGTITKTRHEPDGKVITTTYRIRTVPPSTNTFGSGSTGLPNFPDNHKSQGPFLVREQPVHPHTEFERKNSSDFPRRFTGSATDKNWQPVFPKQESSINTGARPETKKNPIDEFLMKLNLTASAIAASNGEIVKTIIDDSGRVLTASFVLSTVRNDEKATKDKAEKPPIK